MYDVIISMEDVAFIRKYRWIIRFLNVLMSPVIATVGFVGYAATCAIIAKQESVTDSTIRFTEAFIKYWREASEILGAVMYKVWSND